jgi:CRP-like cAMP-binding protein
MAPGLEQVELAFGETLFEAGGTLTHAYFPNNSMVSLVAVVDGGDAVEVGVVGRDSIVGIPLGLGTSTSPVRGLVQGAGSAMRMSAERFGAELDQSAELRKLLARCAYVSMATAMQLAACNKAHLLAPKLARWLLMVRDRLGRDEFPLTQEFLAQMLGVRRAGVTEAAGALQERKLISYSRGHIRLLELEALRDAACPCYGVIRKLEKGES